MRSPTSTERSTAVMRAHVSVKSDMGVSYRSGFDPQHGAKNREIDLVSGRCQSLMCHAADIAECAAERRFGNDAHADLVGDDDRVEATLRQNTRELVDCGD